MAAGEGAKLVCLQELTLSPYFAITADGAARPPARARAHPRRADDALRRAARRRDRRPRARVALRARRRRGRPGLQHGDRRRARRRRGRPHAQAAHPGDRGLLRGQYFRPGPPATTATRSSSWPTRAAASRPAGTSGSPSWRGPTRWPAPRSSSTRRRSARSPTIPDFDTEPLWEQVITANGIANGTFMVAVNRIGDRGAADLLRLVVHQRPVRPQARAGAARRAGGARRRPRPRPAPRLAGAVPVPDDAPSRRLRLAGRVLTRSAVGWCSRAAADCRSPRCARRLERLDRRAANCVPARARTSARAASSVIGGL